MTTLQGIRLALLGGDGRDQIVVRRLAELGAQVNLFGLPGVEQERVRNVKDVREALFGVSALILPMPGIDPTGRVYAPLQSQPVYLSEEDLALLPTGSPLFVGVARPNLRTMAESQQLRLVEVAEMDEVAVFNSVPSAEGAVQIAMEKLPITIHSSQSLVIGFGRVGITLARLLKGMGSNVTVAARNSSARARAWEMAVEGVSFEALSDALARADIIYNTVPVMVLDEQTLSGTNRDALIIDLASAPGGIDFEAARRLGIEALLVPGLPGKVAPKTAGEILARIYPNLIVQHMLDRRG
ncbi:dipicolinate synthase subunit DpsA [Heliobacillus mobilis]|uniref:Dipicolinate synthase subunit DpsA n=1 Tax=Heliobacterium mobile TaxID=28064 RepID=A0A6I3SN79_HELMO|nr:dipicolinate synthase subunit DpsA [Heliobacterium mobile]MTV50480.1 dipicolinate synthase subunit DpsA [Heliobacterium mobile]